jgi:hypothetical protein
MGVVYKARQATLNRLVALKMILAGAHADEQQRTRFRVEAEAVARLQHAHIVQIHEIGETDGCPFFSLEFVEGGSLADTLDGTPWPAPRAAKLVEALAGAVHHAHRKGIVHRDLKPANVLLTAEGQPKVTDFGLARLQAGGTNQTQSGAIVGTPSYMAPEQAEGKGKAIGPATDVYALGAILYELLTGRPPFKAAEMLDTLFQVVTQEPVPPSRLAARVPRDLETVCLKCLQKEAKKRYASAQELVEELARFSRGEPVRARPVGRTERLWRWCRRNPALATASGLALAALVAVAAVAVSFGLYQSRTAGDLRSALNQARTSEAQAKSRLAENYLDRALALCEREKDAAAGLHWMVRALKTAPPTEVELRQTLRTSMASWATEVLPIRAIFPTQRGSWVGAFSPDGKAILTGGQNKVWLWKATSGQPLTPPLKHRGRIRGASFSPDGKAVLTWSGKEARLWSATTGKLLIPPRRHPSEVQAVAFSPDGKAVLTGSGKEARLWSATTGKPLIPPLCHEQKVVAAAFSPDGKTVLTGSGDPGKGETRLWSVTRGKLRIPPLKHKSMVDRVAFSPDGKTILTRCVSEARLWSATTGQPLAPPLEHFGFYPDAILSPDGKVVLTGGGGKRGCGKRQLVGLSLRPSATGVKSMPWPSAPTARPLSPAAGTIWPGSGNFLPP